MKKHYGWVICAGCLLLHFCACGLVGTAFSVYLPYIKSELGLSFTQTSLINTARCMSTILAMTIAGAYYKRFSLRLGTAIACLLLAAACVVFSQAQSSIVCYLAAIIMGVSYGFGTMIAISLLVHNWFIDRRSTATAIGACGSSVSTAFAPPIITKMIERFGVSEAFLIEAVFVVVCAGIIFLILRDYPADLGMAPYQEEKRSGSVKMRHQSVDKNLSTWEMRLLLAAPFIVGFAGQPSSSHLAIHYTMAGFSGIQAATAISLLGVILAGGKFLFGLGTDRFGTYHVNYVFLFLPIFANLITAMLVNGSLVMLYLSALISGAGLTIGTIGIVIWAGDFAPAEKYAGIIQRNQTLFALGSMLGNPIPGIIADAVGNYRPAYYLFAAINVLTLLIVQTIYHKYSHFDSFRCQMKGKDINSHN